MEQQPASAVRVCERNKAEAAWQCNGRTWAKWCKMMQNVQSSLLNSLKFSYGFNFSRDGHSISFIPSDYFWDLARSTVRVATSWFRTASICRKMWLKQAAAHPLRRLGVKDGFHENRFESREIENRQIIQQSAHSPFFERWHAGMQCIHYYSLVLDGPTLISFEHVQASLSLQSLDFTPCISISKRKANKIQ